MPDFSVIIPSHNGGDTLPRCLKAVEALESGGASLEVLLIDNDSNDTTLQTMEDFAVAFGAKIISVPERGKSFALNKGLKEAVGEVIVFLDDDTVPDPDLLQSYATMFQRNPDTHVLAGRIMPLWTEAPPTWLSELAREGLVLGCTPANLVNSNLSPEQVKGGNFAVRRSVIGKIRFDEGQANWGMHGASRGGEDTDFVRQLSLTGCTIGYAHSAAVGHIIQPNEMTVRSLIKRTIRVGRSNASSVGIVRAFRLLIEAAAHGLTSLLAFVAGRKTLAARSLRAFAYKLGQIDGLRIKPTRASS